MLKMSVIMKPRVLELEQKVKNSRLEDIRSEVWNKKAR